MMKKIWLLGLLAGAFLWACDDDDDDQDAGPANAGDAAVSQDASTQTGDSSTPGGETTLYEMRLPPESGTSEYTIDQETWETIEYAVLMTTEDLAMSQWMYGIGNYWGTITVDRILGENFKSCSDVEDSAKRDAAESAIKPALEAIYAEKTQAEGKIKDLKLMINSCGAPQQ